MRRNDGIPINKLFIKFIKIPTSIFKQNIHTSNLNVRGGETIETGIYPNIECFNDAQWTFSLNKTFVFCSNLFGNVTTRRTSRENVSFRPGINSLTTLSFSP